MGTLAITIGLAGAIYCLGYALLTALDRYNLQVEARLEEFSAGQRVGLVALPQPKRSSASRIPKQWSQLTKRLIPNSEIDRQRHEARLVQAGIYRPAALTTYFTIKLGLMVTPPIVGLIAGLSGAVPFQLGLVGGCVAGGIGMVLPSFWLDRKIRLRHHELRCSAPDFLDLLIVCLEGGLSLPSALQHVTEELRLAHPIMAGEMGLVQRDIDLGLSVENAFRRLAERSGFDGLRSLSTFMRESQRLGTELVEALRLHADMLRQQREQAAEEMAQKASVKILIPTLLLILPAVFIVLAGPAAIKIQQAFSK